jgi:hypothetical protein
LLSAVGNGGGGVLNSLRAPSMESDFVLHTCSFVGSHPVIAATRHSASTPHRTIVDEHKRADRQQASIETKPC